MIVDRVNSYLSMEMKPLDEALLLEVGKLASWAFNRQFGQREEHKNTAPYFSSIGKCLRQQAYQLLGFEPDGKEIDSRARMVFFQGDIVEIAIIQLAKIAGCEISQSGFEQSSVEWHGMRGRPDGVLGGKYVVEAKSMPSYGFERFERGIIDDAYRYQCHAAMEALHLDKTIIVGLNKDAGVLHEMIISKDPAIIRDIEDRLTILKLATKDNLPSRFCVADSKGFFPWQGCYCPFWRICLTNAERILVGKSYKLKEKSK